MITSRQIEDLSKYYQIDSFTILREYLQLLFLNYLYRSQKCAKVYFKGGTAIHLLLNSPRFSEDLDFSTEYGKDKIKQIVQETEKELSKEIEGIRVTPLYAGQKSVRFRLRYQTSGFKYPFVIRLDFTEREKPQQIVVSPLVTKFPIVFFPLIVHFLPEEMLAEKIRALFVREKGRDVYDLWFLLEKGVRVEAGIVDRKLQEVGKKYDKDVLIDKIRNLSIKKLERDLDKFLPRSQRKFIKVFQNRLIGVLNQLPQKWSPQD